MKHEEILQYYGYLSRLAASKCDTQSDAEDLVADTMLAAFAFLHKGGAIKYPKTWLVNTLYHIFNSNLRKRYRAPATVCIDTLTDIVADKNESDYMESDEASVVRRELNFLAYTTREVLIRYYFGKSSVATIAAGLGIPEGTVKSRLSAGRSQMKKGLEEMENKENHLPGVLNISWGGSDGPNNEPMCLVENDLIAQNLLMIAYDKPLSMSELSRSIGIPAAYIEPIIKKLVDGELMVKTDSERYYTDFIIYKPEDSLTQFDAQLKFVDERFDRIWKIIADMTEKIDALAFGQALNPRQLKKLERYAVLRTLQNFQLGGSGVKAINSYPKRIDGGQWIAMGWSFSAGYDMGKYNAASEYQICGGHRTTGGDCDYNGAKYLQLCEFDTTLWDSPHRFTVCNCSDYFKHIGELLWCIYKGMPLENSGVPNNMIENIPGFETLGMLSSDGGGVSVDIPVMNRETYQAVNEIIESAYNALVHELGGDYKAYLRGNMIPVPSHLKSVPDVFRYSPATNYIVMAAVRQAYDKGLHLKGVDYCCPPVVLVYDE